jgi:AhpD family alkylhydroperoxidase
MNRMRQSITISLTLLALTGAARAETAGPSEEATATYADIKRTLGLVPSFFKAFPPEAVGAAWEEFKGVQLNPSSALPGKLKELIGLAVSAQIPCRYCTYFHTEAARLNGADDRELKEAVVMAGMVRKWSTVLNGQQTDEAAFRQGTDKMLRFATQNHPASTVAVTDAASAYRDIEQTLGGVPPMFKLFPPAGIAGAWRLFKGVQLNPSTALPGKQKELIGLAVAAQIPCRYCVYFHTAAARLDGASETEIQEAIAMAGSVRQWSTFLNGTQANEAAFRKEVAEVVSILRKRAQTASR